MWKIYINTHKIVVAGDGNEHHVTQGLATRAGLATTWLEVCAVVLDSRSHPFPPTRTN